MKYTRLGSLRSHLFSGVLAACCCVPSMVSASDALTVTLEDFEGSVGGAVPVSTANSSAAANSNSVVTQEVEAANGRLKITDADGGSNGAVLTIPGGIPAPGYYLFTADVKVDDATADIQSFGMGVKAGGASTTEISDENAGYVMNLTSGADGNLGYQTIGAAINVPAGGTFPQDVAIYFSTDVSGNTFNGPAADGDFAATHRAGGTPSWAAGSSNAVFVDDIKRIGPGNMGEERHLWISVGDAFTDLAKLEDALVRAKANNFTAVDILARYRGDAYYVPNRTDATYPNPEPFGTRIGNVDVSPANDPLQYAVERGHELGLKVYASFSCFLVTPNSIYPSTLPQDSIMYYLPSGATQARPMLTSDPGAEGLWADVGRKDVRDYTKNVLMDIVMNYDIDGIVFDRIRYPQNSRYGYNPDALADLGFSTNPSPFSAAFRDAKRDAITDFLQECYEEVTAKKPWIVMGATPIAFADNMNDTYNLVMQHWPSWTGRKTANRTVDFGCIDLLQPQFYRLAGATTHPAPGTNKLLMQKAKFGDLAIDSKDFGLMSGAYSMLSPLMYHYHPTGDYAAQSKANAQNITDTRDLGLSGFGLFPALSTLNNIAMIRAASASSAGVDVLAGTPTKVDYLFKAGYDNIAPNAVTNFTATPQSRGSVIFEWNSPAPAADGETAEFYYIYKSTTQPVRETFANLVTKTPVKGNWYHAPVADAGSYYYKIVPADDYNNRGEATEIGPFTVTGLPPSNIAPIIVDNTQATIVGSWSEAASGSQFYGANYRFAFKGTGDRTAKFTAQIPATGTWTVWEFHPAGSNRATDANHLIEHDGGATNVQVNQVNAGGQWNAIGTFNFTAGNSYSVTINNAFTGSVVMADAIRWTYTPTPITPPATPSNLVATSLSHNSIGLTWADNANDELGYEIERTICGGTTVLINLPANTTSFTDTSLAADTEYKYVVRAWKTNAQSELSNKAAARTLPHIPEDIIVDNTDVHSSDIVGVWSTSTFGARYGTNSRFVSKASSVGPRSFTYRFTPERTAVYDISEWHPAGSNRPSDARIIINHAGGPQTVIIDQKINGGKWNKMGQWLFDGGQEYTVVVTNDFTIGDSVFADAFKISYNGEPPTTPAAPSGLAATVISHEEIALSWSDNAVNETSYEVVRTKSGGTPEVIAALAADSISYIDTGLEALTQYTYTVRAINSQGASADSNAVVAQTLSSTPPDQIIDNRDAQAVGSWTAGAFAADKWNDNYLFGGKSSTGVDQVSFGFTTRDTGLYEIFEWHPAGANRPLDAEHLIQHQYGTETVLVNQRVLGGQWNSIGTYAFNGGSNYSVTITDKFLTGDVVMADAIKVVWVGDAPAEAPAAPFDLAASGNGASQVDLTWTDNTDNESAFQIVRNGQVLTTVAANTTAYSDTAASECTQYTYTVRAVVYGRPSADSNAQQVSLDATAPVVEAPAAVVVSTDAGSATATGVNPGAPSVSDNCGGEVVVTSNAPAAYPVGNTTVTWTATDAKGNVATATQLVTVQDTEPPVVIAPADMTATANTSGCFAENIELGLPVATDNTGVATVTNDAPSTYPVGTTTVLWTVTDHHGNSATAAQVITVQDNPAEAPASVSASAQSWDKIAVTWADSPNETLYEIRYATSVAGPYTVAGSTGEGVTSFIVGGLLPNTTYFIVVEAKNACGSADGPVASAMTPMFSGGVDDPTTSDTWDSVEDENAEGGSYVIRARRSTDEAAAWTMQVPVNGTYRLSVFVPSVQHLSTQANYTVSNGPSTQTVVINQRQNAGTWVELGEFAFVAGKVSVNVFQPNNSSNPVVVDGLRVEQLN